jgi:hypothetical protein
MADTLNRGSLFCVPWYPCYKLSTRDLVEIIAERGLAISHTTILRWVQRCVPLFEKRWNRYATSDGSAWTCRRDVFDILPALKDGDSYGAARCSAGRFGGFLLHRVA